MLFEGCTIRDNTAASWGGGVGSWSLADVRLRDCVIADNLPDAIAGTTNLFTLEFTLCDGCGGAPWFNQDRGCIDADPLFADDGTGLAPLSAIAAGQALDSPAIDAGDPAGVPEGTTRTDGAPDCGRLDMGYHAPVSCGYENYCLAAGNSSGQSAEMGACGSTSLTANQLTLHVTGAPALQFGLFFYGADQDFFFVGDGAICVKPPIVRLKPIVLTCLLYTSPSPRDGLLSRMPSSA